MGELKGIERASDYLQGDLRDEQTQGANPRHQSVWVVFLEVCSTYVNVPLM
jgi:hypothetical protein